MELYNDFNEYKELTQKEIMEYANKYLNDNRIVPLVRSGDEVICYSAQNEEELINKIDIEVKNLQEKEHENIAILCRDLEDTERIGKLLKTKEHIKVLDSEDIAYSGGVVVIPSYFAKGQGGASFDTCLSYQTKRPLALLLLTIPKLYAVLFAF